MVTKIAIFASGTGTNFSALHQAIINQKLPAKISLVVVDQPNAPVIAKAQALGIPVFIVNYRAYAEKKLAELAIIEQLNLHRVTLILLAGYMRILTPTLITAYPNQIINIHPALLPNFPGRHGILDAYQANVKLTGVTVHYVDTGIDTGTIIQQMTVPRLATDTLADLEKRIHAAEHQLYPAVLANLLSEE